MSVLVRVGNPSYLEKRQYELSAILSQFVSRLILLAKEQNTNM